ncbi:MAG: oligosaccharide flippase family protein [archaeon]|nr:oligosaccharide flippase family protein [archaeon]
MGIARTFAENAVFQIASNLVLRLSSLFFVVFLAAILSPQEFGTYAWVVGMALLAEGIANAGCVETMINFVSKAIAEKSQNAGSYFSYILKTKLFILAIVVIVMVIFSNQITSLLVQKPELSFAFILAAVFLIFYSISTFFRSVFFATKNLKTVFYLNVFESVIRIILVIGFVSIVNSSYYAVAGYVLSLAIISVILFFVIRKNYPFLFKQENNFDKKEVNDFRNFLMLTSFATILLPNIDFLIISALLPIESVGFYRIAVSWATAFGALIPFIMLAPYIIDLSAKGKQNLQEGFNSFFKYNMVFVAPLAFGLSFFSKILLSVFYKQRFEVASSELLFVLAFLIMFQTSILIFSYLFNALKKPKITTFAFIGAIILGIILNYFAITSFGLIGAAYATLATYIVLFIALFFSVKPVTGIAMHFGNLLKPIICSALMFGFLFLLPQNSNIVIAVIYAILAGIFYFVLLLATKTITISEILHLKNRIINP